MKIDLNWNWKLVREKTRGEYPAKVPGTVHTCLLDNGEIKDPFYRTNEKDLQWIDKEDWSYISEFKIDDNILSFESIEICFKGLDTYADIYLNDSLLISSDNMFREWRADVKPALKAGINKLRVYFHSPVKIGIKKLNENGYPLPAVMDQSENGDLGETKVSPFTRKAPYHYGWDWGPRFVTSGIWRPLFLEAWNDAKIENVQIVQNMLNEEEAKLTSNIVISSNRSQKVKIEIKTGDKLSFSESILLDEGENRVSYDFSIDKPELWWTKALGKQKLYDIKTSVLNGTNLLSESVTRIGLRTIELVQKRDEFGTSFHFELNRIPIFIKGANHIPNDVFPDRVHPELYEREIKTAAESNMNMIRVWGGGIYEDDVFYDLCDKYGILVWQDFMFACSMYPGDEEFLQNVKQEAIDNVTRLRNHPSLALWCGNNEIDMAWSQHSDGGWGWKEQYNDDQRNEIWNSYETLFHKLLPEVISEYDPSRNYWPSSPMAVDGVHESNSSNSGDMHYWGVWHGKEPFSKFIDTRTRFMSEYGFQSFPEFDTVKKYALPEDFDIKSDVMSAHQRSGIGNLTIKEYMGWYYKKPKNFENFLYVGQVLQAEGIKMAIEAHRRDMPYNMGTLYWQLNDCWPGASWSSIDYYGKWKALQYFAKKAFEEILVSPIMNDDSVSIHIVSDKLENQTALLKLELIDFDGNILMEQNSEIEIVGNSSGIYSKIPNKTLFSEMKDNNYILTASLTIDGKSASSNLLYFDKIKNLNLPETEIRYKIIVAENLYDIELTADKIAKNVYLSVVGDEGFFSDNYFDLLPGRSKSISYKPADKEVNLEENLRIVSLVDSYSKEGIQ